MQAAVRGARSTERGGLSAQGSLQGVTRHSGGLGGDPFQCISRPEDLCLEAGLHLKEEIWKSPCRGTIHHFRSRARNKFLAMGNKQIVLDVQIIA